MTRPDAAALRPRRRPLPALQYFDDFARHLDERAWNPGNAPWAAWAWKVVAAELGADPRGLIVDLGTGTGAGIEQMLQFAPRASYLGVDFSPRMIEQARRKRYRTADTAPQVEFRVCRIDRLRLRPGSVAHFVSAGTFHHVRNKLRVAQQLCRMLEPGGSFVDVDHFSQDSRFAAETRALRERDPEQAAETDRVRASFEHLYEADRQHPIEFHTDPHRFAEILLQAGFASARVHASMLPGYAVVAASAPCG